MTPITLQASRITQPIFISVLVCCLSLMVCCRGQKDLEANLTDIGEVHIGNQIWMNKHLDVKVFRNGDSIPEVTSREAWQNAGKAKKPAWCYYENDSAIGEKYGTLYNWYAVNDPRGLAPEGWHVPTNEEWITLEEHLGLPQAGAKMKCGLDPYKASDPPHNNNFCALLGGYRTMEGNFTGLEEFTYLTGVTEDQQPESKDKFFFWGRGLHIDNATVMRCGLEKEFGLYVRCLRNEK